MTANGEIATPSVIVGLGNPGSRYARNRHNAGFMTIDALAAEAGTAQWDVRRRSLGAWVEIEGCRVLLAKPQTYMNASGVAVAMLAESLGLTARDFVVVLEDINLPFGRLRVRPGGSAGGHHGLESVIEALLTEEVPRIRLGVGEENMPADKAGFVLADFPPERGPGLQEMIDSAAGAAKMVVSAGISRAMSVYNA